MEGAGEGLVERYFAHVLERYPDASPAHKHELRVAFLAGVAAVIYTIDDSPNDEQAAETLLLMRAELELMRGRRK